MFPLFATGIVDTCGKFSRRYRWQICRQCQHHMRNWWQNLPPVSLIPVANLPPVSLIPAAILPPVSSTPVVHLYLRISPRIFEKIRNDPNVIFRGLGVGDSWKNLKQKIRDTVPLIYSSHFHDYCIYVQKTPFSIQ